MLLTVRGMWRDNLVRGRLRSLVTMLISSAVRKDACNARKGVGLTVVRLKGRARPPGNWALYMSTHSVKVQRTVVWEEMPTLRVGMLCAISHYELYATLE